MTADWTPVAVVTGAASGIGLATIHALLDRGASVVATDVSADVLSALDGVERVVTMAADAASDHDNAAMVQLAEQTFGRLDVAVLNAGVRASGEIDTIDLEMSEQHPDRYELLRRVVPMQRWAAASEVAEAIVFLASPAASFITGVALPVDGGVTASTGQALPRFVPADELQEEA